MHTNKNFVGMREKEIDLGTFARYTLSHIIKLIQTENQLNYNKLDH